MKIEMVIRDCYDEEYVTRIAEVTYVGDLFNSKERLIWVVSTLSHIEKDYYYKFVVAANNATSAFMLLKDILNDHPYNVPWNIEAIGVDHDLVGTRIIAKVN